MVVRTTVNWSDWKHSGTRGREIGTRFHNQQWTFNTVAQQKKTGVLTGSFGAWGMRREFIRTGEEALVPAGRPKRVRGVYRPGTRVRAISDCSLAVASSTTDIARRGSEPQL